MADDWTDAEILANDPGLTHADIAACLAHAREPLRATRDVRILLTFDKDFDELARAPRSCVLRCRSVSYLPETDEAGFDNDSRHVFCSLAVVILSTPRVSMHRRFVLGLVALLLVCAGVRADTYPVKPIRVIIPFGAGSAADVIPRIVLEELSVRLGQPVIVENRAGAGGAIGATAVAKAEPDGYTLLVNSSAHTIAPSVYPSLSYDTARDFAAVGALGNVPNVLIIAPSKGIPTLADFVAAAKAKPNGFNFASLGVGSAVHLSAERFRVAAGYEAVHIPFKGGAEALTEVIAGRVEYYFCPIATALPHIRDGRLLALAVSSPKRASLLPDVPTTLEAGFPDSDYTFWLGMFAPAKTPREIVEKLARELTAAVAAPAVREKFAALGVETMSMSPAEFDSYVKGELTRYTSFARAAGLKPN
jgi:tripartite-type tricarboxylate transporter receptor subunit TctC